MVVVNLAQPQTLSRHQISIATPGRKISVMTKKTSVATQTTQLHWEPCHNTNDFVVTQSPKVLSRTPLSSSRALVVLWLENPVATEDHSCNVGPAFSVATKTQKWAVAHSGPLHLQFFPFSFLSKHYKFNTQ